MSDLQVLQWNEGTIYSYRPEVAVFIYLLNLLFPSTCFTLNHRQSHDISITPRPNQQSAIYLE